MPAFQVHVSGWASIRYDSTEEPGKYLIFSSCTDFLYFFFFLFLAFSYSLSSTARLYHYFHLLSKYMFTFSAFPFFPMRFHSFLCTVLEHTSNKRKSLSLCVSVYLSVVVCACLLAYTEAPPHSAHLIAVCYYTVRWDGSVPALLTPSWWPPSTPSISSPINRWGRQSEWTEL